MDSPKGTEPAARLLSPADLLGGDEGFRQLIEHGTNLFYAHTAEHVLTYLSPQTRRFFDCEPEEALKRWTEFATDHPLNALGFEATERAIRTGEQQQPYELELVGVNGRKIWVRVNEAPVVVDGKTVGIVGALTDVTEVKKAEADLRRLAKLVRSSSDAMTVRDLDGKVIAWNPAAERLYGWMEHEMLGESIARIVPEELRALSEERVRILAGGGSVESFETKRLRKDGALVDVWLTTDPLHDESGRVVAIATTERDVTERRRAEEALRESEESFRALAASTQEAIVTADADGVVVYANPAVETVFGHAPRDLFGRPLTTLMPERFREAHLRGMARFLASDERRVIGRTVELTGLRKDGTEFPIELSLSTWHSTRGRFFTGIVRDITERKQAEEARRAAHAQIMEIERLREQDRFKTQFLNSAAHEMSTPLTPLRMQIHLLRNAEAAAPLSAYAKNLDILDRGLQRLSGLVQEVLDAARLQADRLTLQPTTVDLHALLDRAVTAFRAPAARKGVAVHLNAPSNLACRADEGRLTQVVFNLLSNAVKFTPTGGEVFVSAEAVPAEVRVAVRDTGIGLPSDAAERLFRPFHQLHDPMQTTEPGAGLGLFVSRGIVELHGGSIGCHSPGHGQGATFWFSLPRS